VCGGKQVSLHSAVPSKLVDMEARGTSQQGLHSVALCMSDTAVLLLLLLPCLLQFMNMMTAKQSAECALAAYPYILNIPACKCQQQLGSHLLLACAPASRNKPPMAAFCWAVANCHCSALLVYALKDSIPYKLQRRSTQPVCWCTCLPACFRGW
jgi:hypothetical protein